MSIDIEDVLLCIDSSAFIDLQQYYAPDIFKGLWYELEELFNQDKIISHILVFEEITTKAKYKDKLAKWILPKRKHFKNDSLMQAKYVSEIVKKFPGLIDYESEKDQADPWVIALAIETENAQMHLFQKKQKVFIVSQENKNSPQKIPSVSKYFGIKHFNLHELFIFFKWDFVLRKR